MCVSAKTGVSEGVSHGVPHTPGTLSGHSPRPEAKRHPVGEETGRWGEKGGGGVGREGLWLEGRVLQRSGGEGGGDNPKRNWGQSSAKLTSGGSRFVSQD